MENILKKPSLLFPLPYFSINPVLRTDIAVMLIEIHEQARAKSVLVQEKLKNVLV